MTGASPSGFAAPNAEAPLLRAVGVSITHRDSTRRTPRDVHFTVEPGEALLLLGPSGCGKSTLALALSGLIPKDVWAQVDGDIALSGTPLRDLELAEASARVATVFQDPDAQMVTTSVFDEVAFGPENLCVPAPEIEARVEHALKAVGLWERRDDAPDVLSGGGRQRLAIAAAIAQGAPLIVLDEPTANLDPHGAREVYDVLDGLLASRSVGVVLVEHNLDEALRIATRVVVLDHSGLPVLDGSPTEVFGAGAHVLEELGVWQPIAAVASAQLRSAGIDAAPTFTVPELRAELLRLDAIGAFRGMREARRAASSSDRAVTTGVAASGAAAAGAASAPATDHVVVRDLTVRRGHEPVLDRVSLRIPHGAFVAVVGPNGAGKTTLLQAIAGIETPPRGAVAVADRDVARLRGRELRDRIGYVFQNPEHQFLATTVRAELALELEAQGFADDVIAARVAASLERFGLAEVADLHPFLLSGGQKRRLSVATSLVSGAPLLVLDEPTFGQDRARAAELISVLSDLNRSGTTVVMATHDLQLAAEEADLLVVVADGGIIAAGPTAEVIAGDALDRVGLERPPLAHACHGVAGLQGVFRLADLPGGAA